MVNQLWLGITKRKDICVRARKTVNSKKVTLPEPELFVGDQNEIDQLLADEEDVTYQGNKGRYNVQKYTLSQMKEKIDKYFEELYPLQEPTEEQKELYPEKVLIRNPPTKTGSGATSESPPRS